MARRRRSRLGLGSAMVWVASVSSSLAWAGPPPPPPPNGGGAPMRPGAEGSAPPPPSAGGSEEGSRIEAPSDPLVIDQRTPETDITGNWHYSHGRSHEPNYVRQADEDDEAYYTVNPIGYYQGVSVSGGNSPPFAPREVGGRSAVMTWAGFERGEASSRVFFQLSAAVEPKVVVQQDQVIVELPHTAVQVRNNRRKLITRYFKTPVTEVDVQRKGKNLRAVIELRWPSEPTWEIQPGPNGYQLLMFEFPDVAGQAETTTEGTVPEPPATADAVPDPNKPVADSTNPFLPTE